MDYVDENNTDSNSDGLLMHSLVDVPDPLISTPVASHHHIYTAEPVDHALSGSISSMAVFATLYPLDVARTRQQAASTSSNTPSGVFASLYNIWEQEGMAGLYSGMTANLISIGTSQCLYFFFYELIKDAAVGLSGTAKTSLVQDLFVAFIAGTINCTVTCPMWVAATRLKLAKRKIVNKGSSSSSSSSKTPTFAQSLVDVIGSGDAWKGLSTSLILCANPALQYGIYEQLKGRLLRSWARKVPGRTVGVILNPLPAFVIGAIAKAIATLFTYPLQLVQTRTREKGFNGGMWGAFLLLVNQHGMSITPYFRGMNSKLVMTVLNASLMFMLKETVLLNVLKIKRGLGSNTWRLLRWTSFVFVALKVGTELSFATKEVEKKNKKA